MHDAKNCITDYKKLKKAIVRLYKQYVTEEIKKKAPDGMDASVEF